MRPWELKHWAYYAPGKRQVMIGWLNFPIGNQLMLDLYRSFHFPNQLDQQAEWIQKYHPDQYSDDAERPLKEQRQAKWYGWCGSDWIANGVKHYNMQDHIGMMLWSKYFPPSQWKSLFDGAIRPNDPRLRELNELHLHGHRIFNYGNAGIFNNSSKDSVFTHLWNKHFG